MSRFCVLRYEPRMTVRRSTAAGQVARQLPTRGEPADQQGSSAIAKQNNREVSAFDANKAAPKVELLGSEGSAPQVSANVQGGEWWTAEAPQLDGAATLAASVDWSKANFTGDQLQVHIAKHLAEWPDMSAEQYLARARELLASPVTEEVPGHVNREGVLLRYDRAADEFAVGTPSGEIWTLFRPGTKNPAEPHLDRGWHHWQRQLLS